MDETPLPLPLVPDYEAIDAASTLENWLLVNKPIGEAGKAYSFTGWLETVRDIRHHLRYLRDNPPKEKKPNEPLWITAQNHILDGSFS